VGPLLGGVFTDKIGWRWCFWINLPLGALSIVGIVLCLHTPKRLENSKSFKQKLQEVDYIGPLIFIPGIISLLLALEWGGVVYPWNSPIIISLLCTFTVLMPVWVYSQIRLGEKATIPIRLIWQRTLLFSSIYSFCYASYTVLSFYLPLYFQAVKDSRATESGIQTLPLILSVTFAAIIGGFLISIVGYVPPFMIIGNAIMAVGAGLLTTLDVDTPIGKWLGFQVIAGIGCGLNLQVYLLKSDLTNSHR
jgi:MFS family permease